MTPIAEELDRLRSAMRRQSRILDCLTFLTESSMKTIEDALAALDDLETAVAGDETAEEQQRAADQAEIADLKAQLAAAEPQDLQPLLDRIAAIQARITPPAPPTDPQIPPGEAPVP